MKFLGIFTLAASFALSAVPPTAAHEFWLEPDDYTPERGAAVQISHNYGQNFKGDGLPFVAEWHQRYLAVDADGERSVTGYDGDLPAVTTRFLEPGLKILAYDGTPERQDFETLQEFETFLIKAGLGEIADRHRTAGKRDKGIVERYARKAKLLLGVGEGDGRDRAVGLRLELVAGRNPYTLKPGALLPVWLLFDGKPLAGVPVFAFNRKDPANPAKAVTDAKGRVEIALPVAGPYLISAIHMFEPASADTADWSSLWASLTFAVP